MRLVFAVHSSADLVIKFRKNKLVNGQNMASSNKLELLNFFGVKSSRRHILICVRCGSDNIKREHDRIECMECRKVISVKS